MTKRLVSISYYVHACGCCWMVCILCKTNFYFVTLKKIKENKRNKRFNDKQHSKIGKTDFKYKPVACISN